MHCVCIWTLLRCINKALVSAAHMSGALSARSRGMSASGSAVNFTGHERERMKKQTSANANSCSFFALVIYQKVCIFCLFLEIFPTISDDKGLILALTLFHICQFFQKKSIIFNAPDLMHDQFRINWGSDEYLRKSVENLGK